MIQAFANTLGASPGADQLGTREEAAAWLRTAGLLPAEAGLSNSEHAALLRLREWHCSAHELAVTGEQSRGPVRVI